MVKHQMLKLERGKHESEPELQQSHAASNRCRYFLASFDVEPRQWSLEVVQLSQRFADVCFCHYGFAVTLELLHFIKFK